MALAWRRRTWPAATAKWRTSGDQRHILCLFSPTRAQTASRRPSGRPSGGGRAAEIAEFRVRFPLHAACRTTAKGILLRILITEDHAHAEAAAPRRTAHRGYCHTGGPAHLRSLVVRLQMPQQERLGAGWRSSDAVHCGCVQRLLRARAGSIASLQRAAEDRTPTVQLGGSRRGRARRADRHLLAASRQPDHPAVRRGRRSVQRVRRVHVGRAALVRPGQDEPRGRTAAAQRAGGPLRARLLRAGAARPPARPAVASQRAVLTRGGGGGVRRDGRGGHRRRLPRLRAAARGGRLRRDAAGQGDDGVALDDPQDLPRERAAQARPAPCAPRPVALRPCPEARGGGCAHASHTRAAAAPCGSHLTLRPSILPTAGRTRRRAGGRTAPSCARGPT